MLDWERRAREDLARAVAARAAGNEGRARVCARRAAGWAAKAYLENRGLANIRTSGFENIAQLLESGLVSSVSTELIARLTSNMETENERGEEVWPAEIDLLADARQLIGELFPHGDWRD